MTSRKDITDREVVWACSVYQMKNHNVSPFDRLVVSTRLPRKVVRAAMERAYQRGLVDFGVSLETAWPTEKGLNLLASPPGPTWDKWEGGPAWPSEAKSGQSESEEVS